MRARNKSEDPDDRTAYFEIRCTPRQKKVLELEAFMYGQRFQSYMQMVLWGSVKAHSLWDPDRPDRIPEVMKDWGDWHRWPDEKLFKKINEAIAIKKVRIKREGAQIDRHNRKYADEEALQKKKEAKAAKRLKVVRGQIKKELEKLHQKDSKTTGTGGKTKFKMPVIDEVTIYKNRLLER